MMRTIHAVLVAGILAALSAQAAVYRFEVTGGGLGTGNWATFLINSSWIVPAEPSAPPGYEITYPDPVGTDSLTWRNRQAGYAVRTCLSCSNRGLSWLGVALSDTLPTRPSTAAMDTQWRDTQQVVVGGASRKYFRASNNPWPNPVRRYQSAFLEGVGTVYFHEREGESASYWYASLRLLQYNDLDIDTLWGNVLPGPTAIAPPARRGPAARLKPRRFDLHEMGIFLGRKSALREPLPSTR